MKRYKTYPHIHPWISANTIEIVWIDATGEGGSQLPVTLSISTTALVLEINVFSKRDKYDLDSVDQKLLKSDTTKAMLCIKTGVIRLK